MSHRLSNITLALSLLACGIIAVLWVRGYYAVDEIVFRTNWHIFGVSVSHGEVLTGHIGANDTSSPPGFAYARRPPEDPVEAVKMMRHWGGLGFYIVDDEMLLAPSRMTFVLFPIWFPLLCCAATPCSWILRRLRQRRQNQSPGFPMTPTTTPEP